jgi:SAM-dependent methyltransferase
VRARRELRLAGHVVQYHAEMLSDRVRTSSFLDLICGNVRPGDVVVDIGTGTGIFAVAAARAGAAHVYAIEAGPIGRVTEGLFRANDVHDRITLIRDWSTRVQLPRAVDVIVTEVIGNDPLAERVFGITKDAIRRFLKPGGRLIPSGLRILGQPVELPDEEIRRRLFRPEALDTWRSWYGLDFSPLGRVASLDGSLDYVNPRRMRKWKTLSEPVLLVDMDFRTWNRTWIRSRKTLSATSQGRLDGLVIFFELMAGRTPFLSTRPAAVRKDNHWLAPLYLFNDVQTVRSGDVLSVSYEYRLGTGQSFCAVHKQS